MAVNAGFTYWIFPSASVVRMLSAACSTAASRSSPLDHASLQDARNHLDAV
jgi:hypothetical protein